MHRYNYVILSPYFGKLPSTFDLWAQSCGYNPQFLFIVFTDDAYQGSLPPNVQIKRMSFGDLRAKVQAKFDFPVALENPYKLCDYKPALGYVFQDYLQGAAYWGHCDMDLVFGDLSKFLPPNGYDKISHLGHVCLYKNTPEIIKAFELSSRHILTYQEIFSSKAHFGFDENYEYGINAIFRAHNLSVYPFEQHVADIKCTTPNFTLSHYQNPHFTAEAGERIFSVENGAVCAHTLTGDSITTKEYAYVHMQKRCLGRLFAGTPACYLITPAAFEPWQSVTPALVKTRQPNMSRRACWWKKSSVKRISLPRALQRKWAIAKITCAKKLKGKDSL